MSFLKTLFGPKNTSHSSGMAPSSSTGLNLTHPKSRAWLVQRAQALTDRIPPLMPQHSPLHPDFVRLLNHQYALYQSLEDYQHEDDEQRQTDMMDTLNHSAESFNEALIAFMARADEAWDPALEAWILHVMDLLIPSSPSPFDEDPLPEWGDLYHTVLLMQLTEALTHLKRPDRLPPSMLDRVDALVDFWLHDEHDDDEGTSYLRDAGLYILRLVTFLTHQNHVLEAFLLPPPSPRLDPQRIQNFIWTLTSTSFHFFDDLWALDVPHAEKQALFDDLLQAAFEFGTAMAPHLTAPDLLGCIERFSAHEDDDTNSFRLYDQLEAFFGESHLIYPFIQGLLLQHPTWYTHRNAQGHTAISLMNESFNPIVKAWIPGLFNAVILEENQRRFVQIIENCPDEQHLVPLMDPVKLSATPTLAAAFERFILDHQTQKIAGPLHANPVSSARL